MWRLGKVSRGASAESWVLSAEADEGVGFIRGLSGGQVGDKAGYFSRGTGGGTGAGWAMGREVVKSASRGRWGAGWLRRCANFRGRECFAGVERIDGCERWVVRCARCACVFAHAMEKGRVRRQRQRRVGVCMILLLATGASAGADCEKCGASHIRERKGGGKGSWKDWGIFGGGAPKSAKAVAKKGATADVQLGVGRWV